MKFRNLDNNILYLACEELPFRKQCGPLDVDFIYRTFSDIPREMVAASIERLVVRGWLQQAKNKSQLYLTDQGLSKIRSVIPAKLLTTCEKTIQCEKQ